MLPLEAVNLQRLAFAFRFFRRSGGQQNIRTERNMHFSSGRGKRSRAVSGTAVHELVILRERQKLQINLLDSFVVDDSSAQTRTPAGRGCFPCFKPVRSIDGLSRWATHYRRIMQCPYRYINPIVSPTSNRYPGVLHLIGLRMLSRRHRSNPSDVRDTPQPLGCMHISPENRPGPPCGPAFPRRSTSAARESAPCPAT